jgi:DNA repair protein RecO (recombination protein O)
MKAEGLQVWYLRSRPVGETSLRVTFFSKEYGIVDALYKGGRTPKKKQLLQPFVPLWLALNERRNWFYVHKLESDSSALSFTGQVLFAALYLNEIILLMMKPQDASPALFIAYSSALEQLTRVDNNLTIEPVLRRFERVLLAVSGYEFSLTHEAISNAPIHAEQHYRFDATQGFCAAATGYLGEHILAFAHEQYEHRETLRTAKRIMRQAIAYAIDGRTLNVRALYGVKG